MHLEFSKRLCDATLGEFVAAERAVGVTVGWIVALVSAGSLLVARWLYKRLQRRQLAALLGPGPGPGAARVSAADLDRMAAEVSAETPQESSGSK